MNADPQPTALDVPDPKPWWQSRAIIGALVVILAQVARFAGVEIDSAEATDVLLQGFEIAGAGLALWGRVRASQPVRFRTAKPAPLPFDPDVLAALPDGRERLRGHPVERVSADGGEPDRGYWGGPRGPLDPE